MTIRLLLILFCSVCFSANLFAAPQHGIAMHGKLKYAPNFSHFKYTNPNALKGGILRLGVVGDNFDSFNPYIIKGNSAAGLGYLYQSLTERSEDEAFSEYGLIAEMIDVPDDRSSVTFSINKKATFNDGSAITAEDVKFSFTTLTTHDKAQPFFNAYYADVKTVNIIDNHTVQFIFSTNENKELPLILGQMPVFSKAYWTQNEFGYASLKTPLGNGPYKIKDFQPGRSITYIKNENYWAKDLPINKGRYNFDEIVYEYYKDNTVALEAFKAGEYDFRVENTARNWANSYTGKKFDSGELIKEEVKHQMPAGMQAFIFNTRREIFSDPIVREALAYAFDFEWTNKNLFNGQYARNQSYFENSELASSGLPSTEELKILAPFKAQLPPALFEKPYAVPSTKKPNNLRKNLRTAVHKLRSAGWVVKNNQLTHNKTGKVFEFEFLIHSKDFERIVLPFIKNLKKLGITASVRVVDTSQYINRRRAFDFDIMVSSIGQSNSPGNEQREFWHSSKANTPGSRNLAGIQSPVIDKLIDLVIAAPDRKSLINHTHALDRVLLNGHYVIPNWFNPIQRVAYTKRLTKPAISPKSGVSIDTWWFKQHETDGNL